jgi:VCBS repeat protein
MNSTTTTRTPPAARYHLAWILSATATVLGCGAASVAITVALEQSGSSSGSIGPPPVVASIDGEALQRSSDDRGAIAIPFRLESRKPARLRSYFQWRRTSQSFDDPTLSMPTDAGGIDAVLRDPRLRAQHQIATEKSSSFEGRIAPVCENGQSTCPRVRLPELATSAGGLVADGLAGRPIELLRPSVVPRPVFASWSHHPLNDPVAANPIGDGLRALVLDHPASGTWRLLLVDLASGNSSPEDVVASGTSGDPDALAVEPGEASALVAVDSNGAWSILRIELDASRPATTLARWDSNQSELVGPVRGITGFGRDTALLTVGHAIVRVDLDGGTSRALASELSRPVGIVRDALAPERAYVADSDFRDSQSTDVGRIFVFDSKTSMLSQLPVSGTPAPARLALERDGTRLLVSTTDADGTRRIRAIDLLSSSATSFLIGDDDSSGFEGEVTSLATGADGLRLVTLRDPADLAVGGGVEQRRHVSASPYDPAHQVVEIDSDFDPAPAPNTPWRVLEAVDALEGPGSKADWFVWDTADVRGGGDVLLRLVAFADSVEAVATTSAPKHVSDPTETALQAVPIQNSGRLSLPTAIDIADFDGDGVPDLVSANQQASQLTVFIGSGSGTFTPSDSRRIQLQAGAAPQAVAAADVDGDGRVDLVAAEFGGDRIGVCFANSDGGFEPETWLNTAVTTSGPTSVAVIDVNGDGRRDVVCANEFGNDVVFFFQDDTRTFGHHQRLAIPGATPHPVAMAVADVDGDGHVDVVCADGDDHLTLFLLEPGGSPFELKVRTVPIGNSQSSNHSVAVALADVDDDGRVDVVCANDGSSSVTVFFQPPGGFDGGCALADCSSFGDGNSTPSPTSLAVVDLDRDGLLDVVVTAAGSRVTTFLQSSGRRFELAEAQPLGFVAGPRSLRAADFDRDGIVDFAWANSNSDELAVVLRRGPGRFAEVPDILLRDPLVQAPSVQAIATGDLDRDGKLDVAVANGSTPNVSIFYQLSPREFVAAPPLAIASPPLAVAIGDLDGDGFPDVAVAESGRDRVDLFFQTGPRTFATTPQVIETGAGSSPRGVALGDLDGDGLLDVVVAESLGRNVSIYFQGPDTRAGMADFTADRTQRLDWPPDKSLAIADLDDDGLQDLVVPSLTMHAVGVFRQGADPSHPLYLAYTSPPGSCSSPSSAVLADVDHDGRIDIVIGSTQGGIGEICILRNETASPSTLSFNLRGSVPRLNSECRSVAVADVDADGDADVVSANGAAMVLQILTQGSPLSFSAAHTLGDGVGPIFETALAVDLDADGDVDILSPDSHDHRTTIFFGNH